MPTIPSYPLHLTAAGQPAFTTETRCSPYIRSYPLEDFEPTAQMVVADFTQARDSYSRPSPNSTLSYFGATLYFINDENFRDHGCGLIRWTRRWASVPASWSDWEEFPYTYPAFTAGSAGTPASVTAIAASGSNYVISTTVSGVTTGDIVFLNVTFTRNGIPGYTYAFSTKVLGTGSGTITIGPLFYGSGAFTSVSGTVVEQAPGRSASYATIVGSRLAYDYALTTTAGVRTDLPILAPWQPVDSSGNLVTSLTGTTVPTATAYRTLIADGGELIAQASSIRRYMGNIYCRVTRYVPAL